MSEKVGPYHVIDLLPGRRVWLNVLDLPRPKNCMYGLTVMFDHDIVDGAPAARFTRRLVELIESGHGLDEDQPITAVGAEPATAITVQVPA